MLGDGTSATDKQITADNGDANEPFMKYDETLGKWVISNDGVNSYDPEDGGSGVTAGDAISIDAGVVNVKTSEASGIHITADEVSLELQTNPGLEIVGNELGVKVKTDTGLLKDADGIYNDSIDPDVLVAQSAGYLTGGTDVVLADFQTLGAGDNDGAFKINVDGTEYDDVGVDLLKKINPSYVDLITQNSQNTTSNIDGGVSQSFKIPTGQYSIKTITIYRAGGSYSSAPYSWTCQVYSGNVFGSGTLLGSIEVVGAWPPASFTFTFADDILVNEGSDYYFKISYTGGSNVVIGLHRDTTNPYADGESSLGASIDLRFVVAGKNYILVEDLDDVALLVQNNIRLATGKNDLVIYDTDHFVITSATANRDSQILKLMAPTTGTDISLAGYLDLGVNAVETLGDGDDYKLVRLDEDGVLPEETIPSKLIPNYTALNNDTLTMNLSVNRVVRITVTANRTFTTTVAPAGVRSTIIVLTSGTSSYTITFGTGFRTTGTLATGTTSARYFVVDFISDGSVMVETSRTAVMA
jgi:hypothetical protein